MDAFEQAQKDVKTLTKQPSNDDLKFLYAHYKQGTVGDVSGKRPGAFDMIGRAKYDAWAALAGLPQEQAQEKYVTKVNELLATHR